MAGNLFVSIALLAGMACSIGDVPACGANDEDPVSRLAPLEAVAPELRAAAASVGALDLSAETLVALRSARAANAPDLPAGVVRRTVQGMPTLPAVDVLIYDPYPENTEEKPVFLYMHGGGYVLSTAAESAGRLPGFAEACSCVVVSVDYRLAPETPFPGPMEDNLSALAWLYSQGKDWGMDRERIAIGGGSAGGGHAAQLSLAARDRDIPIVFQVLIYPMLDDRTGGSHSVPPHIGHFVWNSAANEFAWDAYLGRNGEGAETPSGAVPARAADLSGLPPAWIGVGSVDLFFSENVEYARRLAEAGVPVELMVLPGGFHAFDIIAPDTGLSKRFTQSWQRALRDALHPHLE